MSIMSPRRNARLIQVINLIESYSKDHPNNKMQKQQDDIKNILALLNDLNIALDEEKQSEQTKLEFAKKIIDEFLKPESDIAIKDILQRVVNELYVQPQTSNKYPSKRPPPPKNPPLTPHKASETDSVDLNSLNQMEEELDEFTNNQKAEKKIVEDFEWWLFEIEAMQVEAFEALDAETKKNPSSDKINELNKKHQELGRIIHQATELAKKGSYVEATKILSDVIKIPQIAEKEKQAKIAAIVKSINKKIEDTCYRAEIISIVSLPFLEDRIKEMVRAHVGEAEKYFKAFSNISTSMIATFFDKGKAFIHGKNQVIDAKAVNAIVQIAAEQAGLPDIQNADTIVQQKYGEVNALKLIDSWSKQTKQRPVIYTSTNNGPPPIPPRPRNEKGPPPIPSKPTNKNGAPPIPPRPRKKRNL